jgi:hypothetical protein
MKGFRHQTHFNRKIDLVNSLLSKSLPYGKWTTSKQEEYLFNRDYEPIMGWNLILKKPIPVYPRMWIYEIKDAELYYDGRSNPIKDEKTLRKCWDILADWSKREI